MDLFGVRSFALFCDGFEQFFCQIVFDLCVCVISIIIVIDTYTYDSRMLVIVAIVYLLSPVLRSMVCTRTNEREK